jgi:acyl carrier protein
MHCAGVFDDRLLADHRWDLFEKLFAAKVYGSWNLHSLTKEHDLECFVLFSSAANLFGAAGLGNYVAANEFMDVLAHHRRRQGLPALSINWGPWSETGMAQAVAGRRRAQWSAAGIEQLDPKNALRALDYLLIHKSVHTAVLNAIWSKVRGEFSRRMEPRFLERISGTALPTRVARGFREQLNEVVSLDRLKLLAAHVRAKVARVLGLGESEPFEAHCGFFELGLDSLASMELRNDLQLSLECSLPSTLTFMCPNLNALVKYLAEVLHLETSDAPDSSGYDVEQKPLNPVAAPSTPDNLEARIVKELHSLERLLDADG